MSKRWDVHLSPDAEAVFREASRSAVADIAAALDALTQSGPSIASIEETGSEWMGVLAAGDHILTVAGRESENRIVIVRIALAETHHTTRAVEVLPLSIATRRRLGAGLEGLDLDLRYTLRVIRRSPLFAIVVIVTLAIGFGGATALLDIVRSVYAGALPFGDGDRLVRIRNVNTSPDGEARKYNLSPSDVEFLRQDSNAFEGIVAMAPRSMSLGGDGPAERVSAIGVSPQWTQTLQIRPVLGRSFTREEEVAGANAGVALISHALWQRRFGGDSTVVGMPLLYDGGSLLIVGVLPAAFNYPYDAAVWTPWSFGPGSRAGSLNVAARLSDGFTIAAARSAVATLHESRRAANLNGSATGYDVATVREDFIREEGRTIQALTIAVLFLLVLAFVNVANLLIARFTTRRVELGVRAALGGKRSLQVRQLLMETVLLFSCGALGGFAIASWLRGVLSVTVPEAFVTQLGFRATGVGGVTIALTLLLGVVAGLVVGYIASRRAVRTDPIELIRRGGRGNLAAGDRRVFDVLVGAQMSLSLALLVGASLLIGRFRDLSSVHPGYELDGVSTMRVTVEQDRYQSGEARRQLANALEERIAAVPGVEAVGITTVNPICCGDWAAPIEVEGRPLAPNEPATLVAHSYVTAGYFGVMSMPLRRGTGFDPSNRSEGAPSVVIDEAFAEMAWPGEDPIGKRVRVARTGRQWFTVIGVVPVTEHDAETRASWFLPYHQDPSGPSGEHLHIMVRSAGGVDMSTLRDVVSEIDPALAVYGVTTMEALQQKRRSQDRLGAIIAGIFAAFGLVLAGFSLYGLLSYSVELRRGEMGLRMALGADNHSILSLILRQAALRLVAGAVFGIVLSFAVNKGLRGVIEGLQWITWETMAALVLIMLVVTLVAAAAPAWRATRIDPIQALRG